METWYLEAKEIVGNRNTAAPADMYAALMETNSDVREISESNIFAIGRRDRTQCSRGGVPFIVARLEGIQEEMNWKETNAYADGRFEKEDCAERQISWDIIDARSVEGVDFQMITAVYGEVV